MTRGANLGIAVESIANELKMNPSLLKMKALSEADKQQIEILQKKIEQQRLELADRSEAISSLQRNFESLSDMCKCKLTLIHWNPLNLN